MFAYLASVHESMDSMPECLFLSSFLIRTISENKREEQMHDFFFIFHFSRIYLDGNVLLNDGIH